MKPHWKYLPIGALLLWSATLAPVSPAQDGIAVTRFRPDPADAQYYVDGTFFSGPSAAAWPVGSKHTLLAPQFGQPQGTLKVKYPFLRWEANGIELPNPVTVTATTSVTEYVARYGVQYALDLVYFDCPDPAHCDSPGAIAVDGVLHYSSAEVFVTSGTPVVLTAYPNPGWVFVGWQGSSPQTIAGTQTTVTVNSPASLYPIFKPARQIHFETVPAGLQILADRATVTTPLSLDWGLDTVHSLAPVSPQQDRLGKYWAFQSWSDGGAAVHAYKVAGQQATGIVVATYVPAAPVTIMTQPAGLQVKVDGIVNAVVTPLNPYYFTWGVGEKHHLEAPLQQTDAQGRVWKFNGWSNGGDATQDIVVPTDADTTGLRLTANYTQVAKLMVTSAVGTLTVQVDGTDCPTPCQVLRDIGEKVRVGAPATIATGDASRLDFDGWPGGAHNYVVTMGEDNQTVSVNYHAMNRVTLSSDPPNGAAWHLDPQSGDGFYNAGAQVSIALTAQPGFKFKHWEGDLSGSIPSGVISMNAPRSVRAILDATPYIAPAGITNSAGPTPSASVAPGSVISIFGANLAAATDVAGDGMLPQTLAGVTVRVADRLLPLVFVSPAQINAVLPDDLPEGPQLLTVAPQGQPEVRGQFTSVRNAPGIFGSVIHEDGSLVTADSPARAGELLTVYGTGFGPVDPARLTGLPVPSSPDYRITDTVEVRIGDDSAVLEKAVAAPGKVGIDMLCFRLIDGAVPGPLKVIVNGVESNSVTIPVQ